MSKNKSAQILMSGSVYIVMEKSFGTGGLLIIAYVNLDL